MKDITFTEWYKETHEEEWHEDFAELYSFAIEVSDKYEKWCEENDIQGIWNG
ncbi:hypothetical protein MPH47_04250 [Psychrobacillus psychrodurans]|uniref:hypothetical protein n=1 Tax=Psychrobacillus psychrodurans TaxID=126157 RepID=UPI001F4EB62A|nr:hypothetical protein [Psychrobacillus psychrodurans]MCK1996457.1 hypothetical protein [Psychrobacillus psychrodurans]